LKHPPRTPLNGPAIIRQPSWGNDMEAFAAHEGQNQRLAPAIGMPPATLPDLELTTSHAPCPPPAAPTLEPTLRSDVLKRQGAMAYFSFLGQGWGGQSDQRINARKEIPFGRNGANFHRPGARPIALMNKISPASIQGPPRGYSVLVLKTQLITGVAPTILNKGSTFFAWVLGWTSQRSQRGAGGWVKQGKEALRGADLPPSSARWAFLRSDSRK